jgi:hypothetical protein
MNLSETKKRIGAIYKEAMGRLMKEPHAEEWDAEAAMHYGPAHIVWDDFNWSMVEWCLENFEEYADHEEHDKVDLEHVRWSLEELAKIPLEEREALEEE